MRENKGMGTNDYKNMIRVAQSNDGVMASIAVNDILADMIQYRMPSAIGKYKTKLTAGVMIDFDDLQQIFLMAVNQAIPTANTEIGNPMFYLMKRGQWAVMDALKGSYRRVIAQHCMCCNNQTRLNELAGVPICPKCGASGHDKVRRQQILNLDDGTLLEQIEANNLAMEDEALTRILIEGFKHSLTGRKLEVFELIMEHGYDRDACTNYIADIAEIMGVGKANVNLRLRSIRESLREYLEQEQEHKPK